MEVLRLWYFQEAALVAGLWVVEVMPQKTLVKFLNDHFPRLSRGLLSVWAGLHTEFSGFLTCDHFLSNAIRHGMMQPKGPPPELNQWGATSFACQVPNPSVKQTYFLYQVRVLQIFNCMIRTRNRNQKQMDKLIIEISHKLASLCLPASMDNIEWHSCRKERSNSHICGGPSIKVGTNGILR